MIDKAQITNMTTKQKVTAIVVLVLMIFLGWQVISMFSDGSSSAAADKKANTKPINPVNDQRPLPAKVPETAVPAAEQAQLNKLQQETQQRYVYGLNELQMLKLNQQIAETNKSIATAKLATIKAQKEVVDMLTPKPRQDDADQSNNMPRPAAANNAVRTPLQMANNQAVSQVVNNQLPINAANNMPGQPVAVDDNGQPVEKPKPANYIAVSVTQLLNRWNAVLSYQGKLYSVGVGDSLPADGSVVISIDRSSITLDKDGEKRKISLVPII